MVDVHNDGSVDSDEVVQLYVSTPNSSVPAPRVRLADFQRAHIKAGTKMTVSLVVAPKWHSVVLENVGGWATKFWAPSIVVEAGSFGVHVGGGQPNVTVGVVDATVHVTGAGGPISSSACSSLLQ